jgi:hypothetical protein
MAGGENRDRPQTNGGDDPERTFASHESGHSNSDKLTFAHEVGAP